MLDTETGCNLGGMTKLMTFEQAVEHLLEKKIVEPQDLYLIVPDGVYADHRSVASYFHDFNPWNSNRLICEDGQIPVFMRGSWPRFIRRIYLRNQSHSFFGRLVFERWVGFHRLTITNENQARKVATRFRELFAAKFDKRAAYLTPHNRGKLERDLFGRMNGGWRYTLNGDMTAMCEHHPEESPPPKRIQTPMPYRETSTANVVYILSNPSMPGLVKIGKTTVSAKARAHQLYSTGVPTPFSIEAEANVADASETEKALHKQFDKFRVEKGREYFHADERTIAQMIEALQQHAVKD